MKLGRKDEINIIAYNIPGTNDLIIGKGHSGFHVWCKGTILVYSGKEMKEVYNIDTKESDFERLGWVA